MAVYDQPKTTYSDTSNQIRAIGNSIYMIDPRDTPLLAALGGLDGARNKFKIKEDGKKIEILEDAFSAVETTLNYGTTLATNTTVFTVADGSLLKVGDVIKIDSEYMAIKAISTDTVTVYSRSYGGTNATHASTDAVSRVGQARLDGADASYRGLLGLGNPYNYTGIFQEAFKVAGTERAIDHYGYTDPYVYEARKMIPDMLRLVDRMAYHGVRAAGSATAPRSAGGLLTYITDNSVNAGGAIVKADIDTLAEYITIDGGHPDILVCHPSIANDIRGIIDSSSFVRVGLMNEDFGMKGVRTVHTQYGDLALIMDRWCPTDKVFMLDSSRIGYYTLRDWETYPLAKTGDADKGEVIGEFSLLVANDKAHGWIYGITT